MRNWNKGRVVKLLITITAIVVNIIWYSVELAGETGFASLWALSEIAAIFISLILAAFTISYACFTYSDI